MVRQNYDVLRWVNILTLSNARPLYSALTFMASQKSTFSVILMNSVIGSIDVSGQARALIVSCWPVHGPER